MKFPFFDCMSGPHSPAKLVKINQRSFCCRNWCLLDMTHENCRPLLCVVVWYFTL